MSRILITGAAGSIGSSLTLRLLSTTDHTVCAFDNSEDGLFKLSQSLSSHPKFANLRLLLGDIRDINRLELAMSGVEYVYHLAANKHVFISEYNPFEAVSTNLYGTQNIINASIANGVKKVLLTSSDKAVNPSSTMGASKLLSERLFIAANTTFSSRSSLFSVLRFGNVWDTNGSVARIFNNQGLQKQPITLTSPDMSRFFLKLEDAVDFCLDSMNQMVGGEIFVKSMGSMFIKSIAEFFAAHYSVPVKCIGSKPGEKAYEELFTDLELVRAKSMGDTIIILPELDKSFSDLRTKLANAYQSCVPASHHYRSDHPQVKSIDPANYCYEIIN